MSEAFLQGLFQIRFAVIEMTIDRQTFEELRYKFYNESVNAYPIKYDQSADPNTMIVFGVLIKRGML